MKQKKCPYCAETIKKEAIICRFCGHNTEEQTALIKNHLGINDIPVDTQNENKRQNLSFTPNPENNKYVVTVQMKLYNEDYNFNNVIQPLKVNDIVVYIKQGRKVSNGKIVAPMVYVETKERNKGWCFSGHLRKVLQG